jgi:Carboxypeptidase regulatory-like domain/TonB-dependent Receptor Plug Domain
VCKCLHSILLLTLVCTLVFGQGTTSRLVGTVTDPSGAAVPGAQVTLTNEATGVSFHTTTTPAGTYVFEALQVGNYRVDMTAAGFKKFSSTGNHVIVGEPSTVNARLEVGATAETVEVSGSVELVQTSTSGNFGSTIDQRVLQDLPIVGTRDRSPLDLVYTQPGVVPTDANMAGGGIYIHGARDRAWNYTLDGLDDNESSYGGSNTTPAQTNPDALSELQIMTGNGTAEWGRNSGGQVSMTTRSGSNEFHGTAFFFYRTPRFNANEWQYNTDLVGKRQFVQQIPGGSIGGPIRKNKTFFFLNVQYLRTHETGSFTSTVYTAQARQGIFRFVQGGRNTPAGVTGASVDAAGNPVAGLNIGSYNLVTNDPQHGGQDPQVMKQVNMMPLPNNFTVGDGLNLAGFTYVAPQGQRNLDRVFKIDHVINSHQTVFARIYMAEEDTNCDQVNGGQPRFPGGPCTVNTTRSPRNLAFNWRWSPTARTTNEVVAGEQHYVYNFVTPGASGTVPDISWYSQTTFPITTAIGNLRTITTYQAVDNYSHIVGAHNLKAGANLRLVRHQDDRGSVGSWDVTPIIDFSTSVNSVDPVGFNLPATNQLNQSFDLPTLQAMINNQLGRVGNIYQGFVAQGNNQWAPAGTTYKFDARYPELDFYAQDNWKISRNLTLDYGLRWEVQLAPNDAANMIRRPDQAITIGTAPSNSLNWQTGSLYNNYYSGLQPSLGLAWDPTGEGKMSFRANYRLADDRINTFLLSSKIFQNLPGSTYSVVNTAFGTSGGRLSNLPAVAPPTAPNSLLTPPSDTTNAVYVMDPGYRPPKTHMYGAGFQFEVARATKLEVDYIGRHALHLLGAYNANDFGQNIQSNGFLQAFQTVAAGGQSALMNQLEGVDSRLKAGQTGSDFVRSQYASNLSTGSVASLASSIGTRIQNGKTIPELAGLSPYFFVPYPQFMGGMYVIDSNDYSHYNGLEIRLERAFSNGASFQFSYTLSKSMDTRSFDPTSTVVSTGTAQSAGDTPFDLHNRDGNYAYSDFDRRHAIQGQWTYELPFGTNKKLLSHAPKAVNEVVGGWEVAGFLTVFSPRPYTLYSGQYTFSSVVTSTINCTGSCNPNMGTPFNGPGGYVWYYNANQIAQFSTPAAGTLGNTGRNAFRQPWLKDMDMSLIKRFAITERHKLELRIEATNLTNSVSFGYPTTSLASSTFGRIKDDVVTGSRKIQMALKYNF